MYKENSELKHLRQGPNLQKDLRACISVELQFWKSQNTVTHRKHSYLPRHLNIHRHQRAIAINISSMPKFSPASFTRDMLPLVATSICSSIPKLGFLLPKFSERLAMAQVGREVPTQLMKDELSPFQDRQISRVFI